MRAHIDGTSPLGTINSVELFPRGALSQVISTSVLARHEVVNLVLKEISIFSEEVLLKGKFIGLAASRGLVNQGVVLVVGGVHSCDLG